MDMFPIASWHDVETMPVTSWNIRQPQGADPSTAALQADQGLDVIIVPGLAFSQVNLRQMLTQLII
eukprot:m.22912 g.22912  ORF g.22912 m.22912 type:complete len:66 (+) comp11304_c0_seq3:357-554(+)